MQWSTVSHFRHKLHGVHLSHLSLRCLCSAQTTMTRDTCQSAQDWNTVIMNCSLLFALLHNCSHLHMCRPWQVSASHVFMTALKRFSSWECESIIVLLTSPFMSISVMVSWRCVRTGHAGPLMRQVHDCWNGPFYLSISR